MANELIQSIFIALFVGLASGSVGAFIVLKRMSLVGDALSHVALPGIALALAYHLDPFWGVISFLVAAAIVVWWLEGKTKLPTDALIGLLFTTSLAVGILAIPNAEIVESLFGAFPALSPIFLMLILLMAATAIVLIFAFSRQFLFLVTAPDLAKTQHLGRGYNLSLLVIFSFVVALGIKLVGTLLMGALIIIPAAIAKNLCKSLKMYIIWSTVLGAVISVAGVLLAGIYGFLPGPTIILFGVALFLCSLFFLKRG